MPVRPYHVKRVDLTGRLIEVLGVTPDPLEAYEFVNVWVEDLMRRGLSIDRQGRVCDKKQFLFRLMVE